MGEIMTQDYRDRFLSLRKKLIAGKFEHLNHMQQQAVLKTEGPLLLLAGAGSGKTTVLIHRIANIIQFGRASDSADIPGYITEQDVDFLQRYLDNPDALEKGRAEGLCAMDPAEPWSVIAITFTNKAANQLKERLEQMLGPDGLDVWAMTFHSACCRILRRDIERLGYDRNFVIYDTADSQHVIKQVVSELHMDEKTFAPRIVLNAISRAKDKQQSPDDMQRQALAEDDLRLEQIARIYEEYQSFLRRSNALDFDDIILLTVKLLEEHEDVRRHYQDKFRYVLIDEYQDTNPLQYKLAALLTGDYKNICVVGDDDQSIYKFRGATIDNILNFEHQFRNTEIIRLEQNYRSTGTILEAANAVIRNNKGRKGKTLWTENPAGEKVEVYEASSEAEEAEFVASRIFRVADRGSFNDCAILYRTNAQSNALERAFQRSGVPYRIIGGHRFFDRAEVKDMLAYLYLINNPSDDFHLRRIINNPPRGIGEKTLDMAARQAAAAGCPLFEVISNANKYPSLEKAAKKLLAFSELISQCSELLETKTLPEFYECLVQRCGYIDMLQAKNDTEGMVRAENVRELKSSIVNYADNAEFPTLAGFLEEVALFTDIEQYDPDADAAVMMTMHSAKGLEFPHVFLVGFEEGLFPGGSAAADREEMEEERRLCYVAITRAKKSLAISYATRRMLYGRTSYNPRSRFVDEIPEQYVTGRPPKRPSYEPPRRDIYGNEDFCFSQAVPVVPAKQPSSLVGEKKTVIAKFQVSKGDMVEHNAFGQGMVLSSIPMGGDALLEIAFDRVGTKRLMANSAGKFMKKL